MNNKSKVFIILITLAIGLLVTQSVKAADDKALPHQLEAIDEMIQEVKEKGKIPDVSVVIIEQEQVEYLAYSDTANDQKITQNSLFQIGSMTKAFTGLGILLLEDEGLLSINDAVADHIPWFRVLFGGEAVPTEDFTISHLLYQTSGFNNSETLYPQANTGMSLEEHVRDLSGRELSFYPDTQYAYANTNYHILGLIIEMVSGQSYQDFIKKNILLPLGLKDTYVNPYNAIDSGKMAGGSRLSFLRAYPYDIPVAEGNIPAGYITSGTRDMSRWLQIQMGEIEISEQFQRIIRKSHIPNAKSIVDSNTHYAAGWFVNENTGEIYHSGGTPNYSSKVAIRPETGTAVCVLTNMNASANTNSIASNALDIMEGKQPSSYKPDIWRIFDTVFTLLTAVSIAGVMFIILIIIKMHNESTQKNQKKSSFKQRNIRVFILPSILMLLSFCVIIIMPIIFGSSWPDLMVWAPLSLLWGTIAFTVFSVSLFGMCFVKAIYPNEGRECAGN